MTATTAAEVEIACHDCGRDRADADPSAPSVQRWLRDRADRQEPT